MKYGTEELYGIEPEKLANMKTIDYLRICREAAIRKREALVHEDEPIWFWSVEKHAMIDYLTKAISSREFLLNEMENQCQNSLKKIFLKLEKYLRSLLVKARQAFHQFQST